MTVEDINTTLAWEHVAKAETLPLDPADQVLKEMWQSGNYHSRQPIENRLKKWIVCE